MPRDEDGEKIIDAEATVVDVDQKKRRSKKSKKESDPGPSIDEVLDEMRSMSDSLAILAGDEDSEGSIDNVANELNRIGDLLEEMLELFREGGGGGGGSTAGRLLANGLDVVGEAIRHRRQHPRR